jgi:hypothetical protein
MTSQGFKYGDAPTEDATSDAVRDLVRVVDSIEARLDRIEGGD